MKSRIHPLVALFILSAAIAVAWMYDIQGTVERELFDLFCVQPNNPSRSLWQEIVANLIGG